MSNNKKKLIRRFAVAIVQGYFANADKSFDMSHDSVWHAAELYADAEPSQPEPSQPEHTCEDWWELQGDVTRLTQDVQRLSGTVETLEARIRRAVKILEAAPGYYRRQGFVVSENDVNKAVQILEEGSDD